MGGGGVVAVGPSGGSTVECNMGDGVPMGGMGYGVVTGVDGCAPVSARRTSRSLVLLVVRAVMVLELFVENGEIVGCDLLNGTI